MFFNKNEADVSISVEIYCYNALVYYTALAEGMLLMVNCSENQSSIVLWNINTNACCFRCRCSRINEWHYSLYCFWQFETKQTISKFEGQRGISSADFFGGGPGSSAAASSQRRDYYDSGPDLGDIKDSVKQGVHKVAGRLSNIASGVMNSIQVGAHFCLPTSCACHLSNQRGCYCSDEGNDR